MMRFAWLGLAALIAGGPACAAPPQVHQVTGVAADGTRYYEELHRHQRAGARDLDRLHRHRRLPQMGDPGVRRRFPHRRGDRGVL